MSRFARAYVTGASSGIGRELSRRLAGRGTEVVLVARRADELEALAGEIAAAGGTAHPAPLDVGSPEAAAEHVLEWDRRTGGLDLAVAAAGTAGYGPRGRHDSAEVAQVLGVNVLGACAMLAAASGPMLERGSGTLSAVTSLAGARGMPASGAYSASKAALRTYLESLRVDLEPPLRVVELRPGFVRTPMVAGNRFRMPLLMDVEPAVERCLVALERGSAVCAFPRRLALPLELLRLLPARAWVRVAHLLHPRSRRARRTPARSPSRS